MSEMNEWSKWIEEAVSKKHIKHYEYKHFEDIQEIGTGGSGKVYRAKWKNSYQYFALKSLLNIDESAIKEFVREIELHREVTFHNNIISFHGITTLDQENQCDDIKKYILVMEYADGGSLNNYLKEKFELLTWDDKYKLAYQLASAVLCLHDENIIHRDLDSNNVLVSQNTIKLADFGLSKRVEASTKKKKDIFGTIPYMEPKKFGNRSYSLNMKSDVYSVGVLLWVISSGRPPFYVEGESYDGYLAVQIMQGLRETTVLDTPIEYVKLYTECWDGNPVKRPIIYNVVERLNLIINQRQNEDLSRIISMRVNEITNFMFEVLNISKKDREKAFSLFINASEQEHILAQFFVGWCYNYGYGTIKNVRLAFEYYKKVANKNCAIGQFWVGFCYHDGIGVNEEPELTIFWYKKAANNGNILAMYNLGCCYEYGDGVEKDMVEAIHWYQKSAVQGYEIAQKHWAKLFHNI
ncbi:kinase-like domain-containing protein [Rhizophagus clarus]|uniref:Kinase-like domain-containing protein n=1 Tax=Rhizophagus clarus TaxID=94130 RepID=A0A8H3R588_9GLOM|nr:kinase-like domain-containing protein [Rhizophagus clarus]